jgi:hypothetical protein
VECGVLNGRKEGDNAGEERKGVLIDRAFLSILTEEEERERERLCVCVC